MKNTYKISILLLVILLSSCQNNTGTSSESDGIFAPEDTTFEWQSGEEGGWNTEDVNVESFRN